MRLALSALMVSAATVVGAWKVHALEITHVSHVPEVLEQDELEGVHVRFNLSETARVRLHVYDPRDRLIRTVVSDGALGSGDQELLWDGRDDQGRPAPPESYIYTLEAENADGGRARWDLADFAGETVKVSNVSWERDTGRVSYRLAQKARVRIRIGLANDGPLLSTLIDWAPRLSGPNEEPWDGRDATDAIDLASHPGLTIDINAFSLPRNSILVGSPSSGATFLELPEDAPRRERREPGPHRMLDPSRRSHDERGDYRLVLILPDGLERNNKGAAVVSQPIPVRVEVPEGQLERILNQRSEIVFYVDGRFVIERETGFLPVTWLWDPAGHAPGLHYITANVRGYEGDFGTGTVAVWVTHDTESRR